MYVHFKQRLVWKLYLLVVIKIMTKIQAYTNYKYLQLLMNQLVKCV